MASQLDKFFGRLSNYLNNQEFKKALLVCNKILLLQPEDDQVLTAQCQCYIRTNQIEKALLIAQERQFSYELAYCYYRQQENDKALKVLSDSAKNDMASMLLKAQIMYRLGDYGGAASIYDNLVDENPNDKELMTNWLAAHTAAAEATQEAVPQEVIDKATNVVADDANFEYDYNVSCALISNNEIQAAEQKLKDTAEMARETLSAADYTEDETLSELAIVMVQQAYALESMGRLEEAEKMYLEALKNQPADIAAAAVAANNLMVVRENRDFFDSYKRSRTNITPEAVAKLPFSSQKLVHFNKALLLFHMQKKPECSSYLEELAKKYPTSPIPHLIEASLLFRDKKYAKCEKFLIDKSANMAGPDAEEYLLALAQINVSSGDYAKAVARLRSIESLQHTPGLVATLVHLYETIGEVEEAEKVLSSAVEFNTNKDKHRLVKLLIASGDFFTRHGKHEKACKVYETLMNDDFADIEEIQNAMVNRTKITRRRKSTGNAPNLKSMSEDMEKEIARIAEKRLATKRKKILKARAKRRESFLKSKFGDEFDESKHKVDPERWIPKRFRKGGKFFKKRRGEKLTGGQGAGDVLTRGAQKLDARETAVKKEEEKKRKEEEKLKANEANRKKGGRKKKGKR